MFGSTIALTIGGVGRTLNRVNQDNYGSEYSYRGSADAIVLKIRHTEDSVDGDGVVMLRHNVYVERQFYPTSTDPMKKQSFTFTMRGGKNEAPTAMSDLAIAAIAWLSASTNGALLDISVGVN